MTEQGLESANAFIQNITALAQQDEKIVALALVGSYARSKTHAKSDVDLVVITEEPKSFLENNDWFQKLGDVKEIIKENFGLVQARRVFYMNGSEVEYGITTAKWANIDPVDEGTRKVVIDGLIILCDKKGLLKNLLYACNLQ